MDESVRDGRESAYELLQRGQHLMAGRHHAQAAVVLERAAAIEPGKGSILEALGRACYNSGQRERAAEVFTALLEVDPSADYAHYALGQSLKKLGRPNGARTHLRLALALNPGSALYRGALDRLPPAAEAPSGVSSVGGDWSGADATSRADARSGADGPSGAGFVSGAEPHEDSGA